MSLPLYRRKNQYVSFFIAYKLIIRGDITMIWLAIILFILISFILICVNAIAKRSDKKMEQIMKKEKNKDK